MSTDGGVCCEVYRLNQRGEEKYRYQPSAFIDFWQEDLMVLIVSIHDISQ